MVVKPSKPGAAFWLRVDRACLTSFSVIRGEDGRRRRSDLSMSLRLLRYAA